MRSMSVTEVLRFRVSIVFSGVIRIVSKSCFLAAFTFIQLCKV